MEDLFDKRSSAEQAFLERYMAAAESYERQLEDLRCADAEDYNLLKVRSVFVDYHRHAQIIPPVIQQRTGKMPHCASTAVLGSAIQVYACWLGEQM